MRDSVGANHDHKTTLVSASAAVSAAIASGAIGAGIGVVNDDFKTTAELSGSTITASREDGLIDSGRVSVTADSASEVDTHVLGVAGSVGGAGVTVAVNNLNSTSSALVGSSDVKADGALTVDAHNKVKTKFNSIQAAAGGAAIATGIGINTIDTGTVAQVTGSKIAAKTVAERPGRTGCQSDHGGCHRGRNGPQRQCNGDHHRHGDCRQLRQLSE